MVSDGEQTKSGFFAYIGQRLSGFEPRPGRGAMDAFQAEVDNFPEYYEQYFKRAMEIHPSIVWATFGALTEGARRATARLW